ncbi:tyrosine-type recombinase/integrase [Rhodohalobacter sp. 614A]|uniref:tyrosine-type recombinase/integrase n=1 Tax=Rhodohalobacter sp. 614A TaxID=2908649 RepID=UPI001F2B3FF0|nr:tyrosine-type recombinase/integrase [Rhodohalobacter sp. 614A]
MKDIDLRTSEFLSHCKYEKNLSPKTLKAYQIDLRQFKKFLTKRTVKSWEITDIGKQEIKSYVAHLTKKYAIKSVKRKVATVKAFFNYLEFDDVIFSNPFRKVRLHLKEPFHLPVVLDLKEIQKIFNVLYKRKKKAKNQESYFYKTIIRDIAILELLFATGIRVGELCSLKCSNIDLSRGFIKVNGKGSKERIIQLCNPELLNALEEYHKISLPLRSKKCGYFFLNRLQKPLSTQSVRFMLKKYVAETTIRKTVTPHSFRHTFATMLLEEGVDIKYIQKILGHSSIMTTQIYTHVSNKKQKEILAKNHPRNRLRLA